MPRTSSARGSVLMIHDLLEFSERNHERHEKHGRRGKTSSGDRRAGPARAQRRADFIRRQGAPPTIGSLASLSACLSPFVYFVYFVVYPLQRTDEASLQSTPAGPKPNISVHIASICVRSLTCGLFRQILLAMQNRKLLLTIFSFHALPVGRCWRCKRGAGCKNHRTGHLGIMYVSSLSSRFGLGLFALLATQALYSDRLKLFFRGVLYR